MAEQNQQNTPSQGSQSQGSQSQGSQHTSTAQRAWENCKTGAQAAKIVGVNPAVGCAIAASLTSSEAH